jgi:hypothetical protein
MKNLEELKKLTKDQIIDLANQFPYMQPDLLIQKSDGTGAISTASYKSLANLLKAGHKFHIVGLKNELVKPPKKEEPKIEVEFVTPDAPIFEEVVNPLDELENLAKKTKKNK